MKHRSFKSNRDRKRTPQAKRETVARKRARAAKAAIREGRLA